jgi:hypothetical protein
MTKQTIGGLIRAALARGDDTAKILAEVKAAFPDAQTTSASVAWYRSQAKKAGTSAPKAGKKPATKPAAKAIAQAAVSAASAAPVYHVGKYQPTTGLEGPGFVVTLFRGSAPVARAIDYGNGGEVDWQWFDPNSPATVKTVNWKDEPYSYKGTQEEALFAAYVLTLPKYTCEAFSGDKTPLFQTMDIAVENMVNDMLLLRRLKRLLKKVAYIRDGKLYTIATAPTPEAIEKCASKPGTIVLNTLPEAEMLTEVKKTQN